jgi:3',5'-cyclic AMP phosphodiesterase CpdA
MRPMPSASSLAEADAVRVVQVSDTHLSHLAGVPDGMQAVLGWIHDDPPDLVVHTGDVVLEDPDDERDRSFARSVFDDLPCPIVAIPGNHDIGFYGDDERRAGRIGAFRATWGDDRFVLDLAGWRGVGVDAYLLGDEAHDDWLRAAVSVPAPVAVFIHQPLDGDPDDGWEMPPPARAAFAAATQGADIRLVASGHRHRAADRGRDVWAPSVTLVGDVVPDGSDPTPGVVEYEFDRGGAVRHRALHISSLRGPSPDR